MRDYFLVENRLVSLRQTLRFSHPSFIRYTDRDMWLIKYIYHNKIVKKQSFCID